MNSNGVWGRAVADLKLTKKRDRDYRKRAFLALRVAMSAMVVCDARRLGLAFRRFY